MAYYPDIDEMAARASSFVSKILSGARPSDLPVEQPTRFQLVLNQKSARYLGIVLPAAVVSRADRIIE